MNAEQLFDILGDVKEEKVAEAEQIRPVHTRWKQWAALAACLALVGAVFTGHVHGPANAGGGIGAPNGAWPEGIDPLVASVAVFPKDTFTIYDVEDATITPLTEAEAYGFEPLGAYLPKELPEGYVFYYAMLYETTMKDGTIYYMLRAEYSKEGRSDVPALVGGDTGEQIVGDTASDPFVIFPTNYRPVAEDKIFSADQITVRDIEKKGGLTFHVSYGDVYMGIVPYDYVSAEDFLAMIRANLN